MVGIVGAGQMGEGLAITMERMEGMKACVIVDRGSGRSAEIYRTAGVEKGRIVQTDDLDRAAEAIADGRRVHTTNPALASAPPLHITVEATGVPEMGAKVAIGAIEAGKHVMQMNVEADATVGALLRHRAREAGVIYSLSGGDEPGAIAELYEFATLLGYDVMSVGKGKNNPLIPSANPDTMAETARRQMMNPKMLASFVDGSKTMMEMTTISNALGIPARPPRDARTPGHPGHFGVNLHSRGRRGNLVGSQPGRLRAGRGPRGIRGVHHRPSQTDP